MYLRLLKEFKDVHASFPAGSVIETDSGKGAEIIAGGAAEEVPWDVPRRIDPSGYSGCQPGAPLGSRVADKNPTKGAREIETGPPPGLQ